MGQVREVEGRLQDRLVSPLPDQVGLGPLAQKEGDAVDEDGLARPRLTGQGAQAPLEGQVKPLDEGDVPQVEFQEHATAPPLLSGP